jgi:hypothetical protein
MAQARQQAGQPLSPSLTSAVPGLPESKAGADLGGTGMKVGVLSRVNRVEAKEWGKLPPKLAKDLVEGSRESVSSEYRNQIETYFRVIAEQSRKKKNE